MRSWAAGSYSVGGTTVINSSAQFVGNGISIPGYGISCGSLNAGSGNVNCGALGATGGVSAANYGVAGFAASTVHETIGPIALSGGGVVYLYFKAGIYYGHTN